MKSKKSFVAYYRVSTQKQKIGLSAQKTIVKKYLKKDYPPIKSFIEKESGAKSDRPELHKALDYCYDHKCTLVVAKLDRLSRDLHFLTSIEKAKIDFICCDFPTMDKLQLHIMGSVAQWEREQISHRTSQALQELKSKGKKLGSHNPKVLRGLKKLWRDKRKTKKQREAIKQVKSKPTKASVPATSKMVQSDKLLFPIIKQYRKYGMTYYEIAAILQDCKLPTRRGGRWSPVQANRIALRNGL